MTELSSELDVLSQFDQECQEHIAKVVAWQNFWREAILRGVKPTYDAPYGTSHYANVAQHLAYDSETQTCPLDTNETQRQFARLVKWAREMDWSVKKEYKDDEFTIRIEGISEPIRYMEFYSTRQVVCKKVQTGTKIVPATEAHEEPVFEYVCDKVAFLSVDTD